VLFDVRQIQFDHLDVLAELGEVGVLRLALSLSERGELSGDVDRGSGIFPAWECCQLTTAPPAYESTFAFFVPLHRACDSIFVVVDDHKQPNKAVVSNRLRGFDFMFFHS
jgi:hypothetical protein